MSSLRESGAKVRFVGIHENRPDSRPNHPSGGNFLSETEDSGESDTDVQPPVSMQPAADATRSARPSPVDPAEILGAHIGWLRIVVRARLSNLEDVEDVLQNVACAIAAAPELPIDQRIAPWLYRVAVRAVLQFRRKLGRQRRLIANWSESQSTQESSEPEQHLMAIETRQAVRRALDRLGDIDRQVLLLKYTEHWSYNELSEHLGVSKGAVEHRLTKARQRLKEELQTTQTIEND